MANGYQIRNQESMYFMTFQIVDWVDIFTRMDYKEIIIESFQYCIDNKGLELFAYVIMTNHIHVIIRAKPGFIISNIIRDFKKYTANQMLEMMQNIDESRKEWMLKRFEFSAMKHKRNSKYQIWTHENHPVELTENSRIDNALNYIHQNPVRSRLVNNMEGYVYSSASNYCGLGGRIEVTLIG